MVINTDINTFDVLEDIIELEVGIDNPLIEVKGAPIHRVRKRQMRVRYLDSLALTDETGAIIEIETLEGKAESQVGPIIVLGLNGNVYFNKRDTFINNHILLPLDTVCDCDKNLSDFSVKVDGYPIEFKKEVSVHFSPCEVPAYRPMLSAVESPKPFIIKSNWGNFEGRKGDFIIVRDVNDYFRCPKETLLNLYEIEYAN